MRQTEHQVTPSPDLPPEKARQGRSGTQVLVVLVCALALAAIAWFGAEMFGSSIEPPVAQQVGDPQTVDPAATSGTSPQPSTNTTNAPTPTTPGANP